ncbi:conserved hypothetical protein [Neospora caninum Liverpool]|uniref:Uncharacterized protein n=1 Tax=Neospora caninum (strain Liverpool) TaxID=572307 RepID=F0VD15_NEOCL|nr:conserved hypothetical protein [Neospora caninum Liverpool]CBZ51530.1 conserved hypothetical protein [Neospora caninum Liverpool]|eukprot:XP_003881563.1 conserved hypothetical protein [Neospora caninum Liverpool]
MPTQHPVPLYREGKREGEREEAADDEETWRGVGEFADVLGIPRTRFLHFASPFTPAAGSESLGDGSLVSPFDTEWQPAVALLRGRALSVTPSPSCPDLSSPSSVLSSLPSSLPSSFSSSLPSSFSSSLPSSFPSGSAPSRASHAPSPPFCATVAVGLAWGTAALLLACGTRGFRAATRNASIALRFPRVSLGQGKTAELRSRAEAVLSGQRAQAELLASLLGNAEKEKKREGGENEAQTESRTSDSNATVSDLLRLMRKGAFLTPEEAQDLGIIDHIL